VWAVHRRWWPFVRFDVFDVAFIGWFAVILALPLVVLWPVWLLAKFVGVPWKIIIERDGAEVGDERVRGWAASERRIAELVTEIGVGGRSGHYRIA
jgi:hypothetical protein